MQFQDLLGMDDVFPVVDNFLRVDVEEPTDHMRTCAGAFTLRCLPAAARRFSWRLSRRSLDRASTHLCPLPPPAGDQGPCIEQVGLRSSRAVVGVSTMVPKLQESALDE